MSWWRRPPVPPTNARIIGPDGKVIVVEFVYAGKRGGLHQWVSAYPIAIPHDPNYELHVDVMPAHTELILGIDVIG